MVASPLSVKMMRSAVWSTGVREQKKPPHAEAVSGTNEARAAKVPAMNQDAAEREIENINFASRGGRYKPRAKVANWQAPGLTPQAISANYPRTEALANTPLCQPVPEPETHVPRQIWMGCAKLAP
jgi:hypothetical protein